GVAGAARRVQRNRLLRCAGNVDDDTAAASLHVRDDGLRAADVAEKLAVDRVHEGLVRQIDEWAEGGSPRVVDQDVETTQARGGLLADAPARAETPQIGGNRAALPARPRSIAEGLALAHDRIAQDADLR